MEQTKEDIEERIRKREEEEDMRDAKQVLYRLKSDDHVLEVLEVCYHRIFDEVVATVITCKKKDKNIKRTNKHHVYNMIKLSDLKDRKTHKLVKFLSGKVWQARAESLAEMAFKKKVMEDNHRFQTGLRLHFEKKRKRKTPKQKE